MSMEHCWNDTDRGKAKLFGDKHFPAPICPPKISNRLTWERTRAYVVRGPPTLLFSLNIVFQQSAYLAENT